MEQNDFNLTRAAEQLKLTRHSLRYRMQRLDMKTGDGAAASETIEIAMSDNVLPNGTGLSPGWVDSLIVVGAVLLVALVALIWAASFRKRGAKRQHRHHGHHHHRRQGGFREDFKKTTAGIKEIIHQRQHHEHRQKHRPLNPTLAQTGGLPPIREEPKPPPP